MVAFEQSGLDLLLEASLSFTGNTGEGHIVLQFNSFLLQLGTNSIVHVRFKMGAVAV